MPSISLRPLFAILFVVLAPTAALADTCTWTALSGDWADSNNWDCGHAPGSEDDVVITAGPVLLEGSATVKSLTMVQQNSAQYLRVRGSLTVLNDLHWTCCVFSHVPQPGEDTMGSVIVEGDVLMNGPVNHSIARIEMTAVGDIVSTSPMQLISPSALTHHGTFHMSGDATVTGSGGSILSLGPLIRGGTSGISSVQPRLDSRAFIHVESGTLLLTNDATHHGPLVVDEGATLQFGHSFRGLGGDTVFDLGSSISGPGAVILDNGTFEFLYEFSFPAEGTLVVDPNNSGPLTVRASLLLRGETEWHIGTIRSDPGDDASVLNLGTLRMRSGVKTLDTVPLYNFATLVVPPASSAPGLTGGAAIVNMEEGTFAVQTSTGFQGDGRIENRGTMTTGGSVAIGVPFENSGFIEILGVSDLLRHDTTFLHTGVLGGTGSLVPRGELQNQGVFSPGLRSVATLTVSGDADHTWSNSTLRMDIVDVSGPGTGHDFLFLYDVAYLKGSLEVDATRLETPGTFRIVECRGAYIGKPCVIGEFESVSIVGASGYDVVYNEDNVTLVIHSLQDDRPLSRANTPSAGHTGHPVSTYTGELFDAPEPDLVLDGPLPLVFARFYGSLLFADGRSQSALGPNWTHSFEGRVDRVSEDRVEVVAERGRVIAFDREPDGSWTQATLREIRYLLVESDGRFTMADPVGRRIYAYDDLDRLAAVDDGRGNRLMLHYAGSVLRSVEDGLGRELTFTHQGDRLVTVSDGWRTVTFAYTPERWLSSVTDARGETTAYGYASPGTALLEHIDAPDGTTVLAQVYDAQGRVVQQDDAGGGRLEIDYRETETVVSDPAGGSTTDVHDADGRLVTYTDRAGRPVTITYDDEGRMAGFVDRQGASTILEYEPVLGTLRSITSSGGQTTSFSSLQLPVGPDGLVVALLDGVTLPDGSAISASYDAAGRPLTVTDESGAVWQYDYNERGQVTSFTRPGRTPVTFSYRADGTLSTITTADGATNLEYDDLGRMTTIRHPDGTSESRTLDPDGRMLSRTDRDGAVYELEYDPNGHLAAIVDPTGAATRYEYDALGRLLERTDREGRVMRLDYDLSGRPTRLTSPGGRPFDFFYDADGRLEGATLPGGRAWTASFDAEGVSTGQTAPDGTSLGRSTDARGLPSAISLPGGGTFTLSYDSRGRVVGQTDPAGGHIALQRDARGLPIRIRLPGGSEAAYTYDGAGNLVSRTDPAGNAWGTPRDGLGRVSAFVDPAGRSVELSRGASGQIAVATLPGGLGSLSYSYDDADRLVAVSHSGGASATFGYDARGNLVSASGLSLSRDAEGLVTASNGLATGRDADGRITNVTGPAGPITYRYGTDGLLSEVEDFLGGLTALTHDAMARITSVTRPNGLVTTYAYDANGRVVSVVHTREGETLGGVELLRDARGLVVSATRTLPTVPEPDSRNDTFAYDETSQLSAFTYDALGRLVDDGRRTYEWDGLSRLVRHTSADGTVDATYDATGRVLSRTDASGTRTFVWNHQTDPPTLAVVGDGGQDVHHYVRSPAGALLYRVDLRDNSRRYYHFDEADNTVFITDDAGAVVASYAYGPYGELLNSTGDGADYLFLWQGGNGIMAEDDDLYLVGARYYDALSGRFISRDPIQSLHPADLSPYSYARGNPLRFADPTGLQPDEQSTREWANSVADRAWTALHGIGGGKIEAIGESLDHTGIRAGGKLVAGLGSVYTGVQEAYESGSGLRGTLVGLWDLGLGPLGIATDALDIVGEACGSKEHSNYKYMLLMVPRVTASALEGEDTTNDMIQDIQKRGDDIPFYEFGRRLGEALDLPSKLAWFWTPDEDELNARLAEMEAETRRLRAERRRRALAPPPPIPDSCPPKETTRKLLDRIRTGN